MTYIVSTILLMAILIALSVILGRLLAYLLFRRIGSNKARAKLQLAELASALSSAPDRITGIPAHVGQEFALHPYLGYVYKNLLGPDRHGFYSDQEGVFGFDILQFRGENDYNVVVVGGSVAAMFAIDLSHQLAKVVATALRNKSTIVRVFAFAAGGWRQPQQLIAVDYFRSIGAKIGLVLNLDGFNDVVLPLHTGEVSIFYPTNWGYLAQSIVPPRRVANIGQLVAMQDWRLQLARFFNHGPWNNSLLLLSVWHNIDDWIVSKRSEIAEKMHTEDDSEFEPYQLGYRAAQIGSDKFLTHTNVRKAAAYLWKKGSQLLHESLTAAGIGYLHVLQPNQYVEGSKQLSKEELEVAYDPTNGWAMEVPAGYAALKDAGKELAGAGVNFFDATMIFADHKETLYTDICCHFNRRGNEILLGEIAHAIVSTVRRTLDAGSQSL